MVRGRRTMWNGAVGPFDAGFEQNRDALLFQHSVDGFYARSKQVLENKGWK